MLKSDFGFPPGGFSQITRLFREGFLSFLLASKYNLTNTHMQYVCKITDTREHNIIFSQKLGQDIIDSKMLRQRNLKVPRYL